jgi:hypothetical protein
MDASSSLEERVETLEAAVLRARRVALSLGALVVVLLAAAFVRQDEEVRTSKLVLLGEESAPGVSLIAGPQASLVILGPEGREIMRLGGDPVRLIGEE